MTDCNHEIDQLLERMKRRIRNSANSSADLSSSGSIRKYAPKRPPIASRYDDSDEEDESEEEDPEVVLKRLKRR